MNKAEKYLSDFEARMVSADRKTSNFMIDPKLKAEFKIECIRNQTAMSDAIQSLLLSYIIKSKELHGEL